jgi:endonuclease/exonuclease/phosphatase family metal-dependent hydrolase
VGNDGKINLLKLVDLIKKHQPDVVALQEIDSGMVRSGKLFQARILSLLTGYDEIYGKAVETQEGNYGLAILTKHSFQDFQNIELPSPEATEPRNMLSVVITLPNSRLIRFCNTQLDYKSPLNRGIQAALISKNLGFGLYPTVLCGNFNAAINDHTVDFLPKYWNNAGQFDDSPTHIPTDRRIDYCWTTKGNDFKLCEYRVLKEVKFSDHYPILVVYELSK